MTTEPKTNAIVLKDTEKTEINKVFSNANDFREVGEKITAPIDSIFDEIGEIIDKDPIMDVSNELSKMKKDVEGVYKNIIDNDSAFTKFAKKIPGIGSVVNIVDAKMDERRFNMKSLTQKVSAIFEGFDISFDSLNTSIDIQKKFVVGVDDNLGKVIAYKNFIDEKLIELKAKKEEATDEKEKRKLEIFVQNVEFFNGNLAVLIGNLEMARKRLLIRLDAAYKLSLSMSSSRPIFKVLLSSAVIETSSQKALDASILAITEMGNTIDNLSSDLTDKTIESSKKSEELSSKPILSTDKFIENVTKLNTHFEEIEAFRLEVAKEAKEERKRFEEARKSLENIKALGEGEQTELLDNLNK